MIKFEIQPPPEINILALRLSAIPGAMEKATRNAVKRTLKGARQDASRKIAARYTIKASSVMKTIKVHLTGLSGDMTSKGARNPLEEFKIAPKVRMPKPPAGGLRATVVKGQGGILRRAFVQRHGGVYERIGKPRYPIQRLTGPSSPGMLASPPVSSFIVEKMENRLGTNLNHAMEAVLGGWLK